MSLSALTYTVGRPSGSNPPDAPAGDSTHGSLLYTISTTTGADTSLGSMNWSRFNTLASTPSWPWP